MLEEGQGKEEKVFEVCSRIQGGTGRLKSRDEHSHLTQ